MALKEIVLIIIIAGSCLPSIAKGAGHRNEMKDRKTNHAESFHCVDIYKQPAFQHPLLKNHKIQMMPSNRHGKAVPNHSLEEGYFGIGLENRCPEGTVPIRRGSDKDVTSAISITVPTIHSANPQSFFKPSGVHYVAAVKTKNTSAIKYFGNEGVMNIWRPYVEWGQFSMGCIAVSSGIDDTVNSIVIGWMVQPYLYRDDYPHLFGVWAAPVGQACYDTLCPGFVQVDTSIFLGMPLTNVSEYEGKQPIMKLSLRRDNATKNWLLLWGPEETLVGYWHSDIFTTLRDGADYAIWGGETYSPASSGSPAMGNGHYPEVLFINPLTSYVKEIKVLDLNFASLDASPANVDPWLIDSPDCYDILPDTDWVSNAFYISYGGPEGCKE